MLAAVVKVLDHLATLNPAGEWECESSPGIARVLNAKFRPQYASAAFGDARRWAVDEAAKFYDGSVVKFESGKPLRAAVKALRSFAPRKKRKVRK